MTVCWKTFAWSRNNEQVSSGKRSVLEGGGRLVSAARSPLPDRRAASGTPPQVCPWQPEHCKSRLPPKQRRSSQAPDSTPPPPEVHSSLEAPSSGDKMAATPTDVELWQVEMKMTVCRRTRASRQIFSRPLHSFGPAAEVTEAPSGWQEEAVLFSVPPEGLSIRESHRTSQHSASPSD